MPILVPVALNKQMAIKHTHCWECSSCRSSGQDHWQRCSYEHPPIVDNSEPPPLLQELHIISRALQSMLPTSLWCYATSALSHSWFHHEVFKYCITSTRHKTTCNYEFKSSTLEKYLHRWSLVICCVSVLTMEFHQSTTSQLQT
jgi:hypothetical protein